MPSRGDAHGTTSTARPTTPPTLAGGGTARTPRPPTARLPRVAAGSASTAAAFFDLDKTVIARASIVAFGRPFRQEGLLGRGTMLRALASQLVYLHLGASARRIQRARRTTLKLVRGWERSEVQRIVRQTLRHVIEPVIYAEALELIDRHRQAGRRVYVVSASPEEIVQPLAEYLGVDGCIASRAVVDETGRYTGELERYVFGDDKAEALRTLAAIEGIDLARSFAYSDSATDLPMLEAVGHPVAVNPDRTLARVARARGWEMLRFSRPVTLRERLPAPAVPAAALALLGAALACSLVVARRRIARARAVLLAIATQAVGFA
jgi:HAD superfamily hydrolase (TIGR01490 family)